MQIIILLDNDFAVK